MSTCWPLALVFAMAFSPIFGAEDCTASVEAIRAKFGVPALAAAAVRDGEIVALGVSGLRKVGGTEVVTTDDKWHLGSCTKSMTASLAAMLVGEGKIRWETTVAEVFPEWRAEMEESWRAVTLEQLLIHRSGAPGNAPPKLWAEAWQARGTPTEQRLTFVRGLLREKPETTPGARFIYSNQGYSIAGAMLERVTKQAWETLLKDRLFTPLGLKSAGFGAPAAIGRVDHPWGHATLGNAVVPVPPGPQADNPVAIGPAGTVHASISDFARYAGWHARGSRREADLLSADTVVRLHRPADGQDYAMGWVVVSRGWAGGTALTHTGSNTMWFCVMWVAPEKGAAFVAATNVAGPAADKACDEAVAKLIGITLAPR